MAMEGKVMRLFGLGSRQQAEETAPQVVSVARAGHAPGHEARVDLLDRISELFVCNGLDVSPRNLLIAHAAFSGSSLGLARKIAVAQAAGPITQDWLDEAVSDDPDLAETKETVNAMAVAMDTSLLAFSESARKAGNATGEYGAALTEQANHFAGPGPVDTAKLAEMTMAMIAHTRQVEEDMRRSEKEAAELRASLASARMDADVDHLTGLPNRRAFEAVYEREYREARAAVDCLSIAICDIDNFKHVNDTHGHETGDRVIQAIAEVLNRISNANCHVARHGGEEFVLLFRGLSSADAAKQLDFARETFGARHLVNRHTDEPIGFVTFSGGVANVFGYDEPRMALHAADEALYRAKQEGRNRVLVA